MNKILCLVEKSVDGEREKRQRPRVQVSPLIVFRRQIVHWNFGSSHATVLHGCAKGGWIRFEAAFTRGRKGSSSGGNGGRVFRWLRQPLSRRDTYATCNFACVRSLRREKNRSSVYLLINSYRSYNCAWSPFRAFSVLVKAFATLFFFI